MPEDNVSTTTPIIGSEVKDKKIPGNLVDLDCKECSEVKSPVSKTPQQNPIDKLKILAGAAIALVGFKIVSKLLKNRKLNK